MGRFMKANDGHRMVACLLSQRVDDRSTHQNAECAMSIDDGHVGVTSNNPGARGGIQSIGTNIVDVVDQPKQSV
ncbi:hypothetical protein WL32_38260 [Burkholderia cepacia]|nr:hypothetical protein WL32_38260 [Burkholderia cepacia]